MGRFLASPEKLPRGQPWVRNFELASYLGVSKMTVWRLKHDEKYKKYNFPPASEINDLEFNDLDAVDKWMEARVAK
jgi:predicted DNA-binding transcriptional regulator AlpA